MQQFTARTFNQHTSEVQRQAKLAPVLITNRGKPDQVLMSYDEFTRLVTLKEQQKPFVSLADALGHSDVSGIDIDFDDFELDRVDINFRPVEF